MTRKEIYKALKASGLTEAANAEARKLHQSCDVNFTNLTNETLLRILDTVKSKDKPKSKTTQCTCVDEGARKAIRAIAAYLNLQGIEKNF